MFCHVAGNLGKTNKDVIVIGRSDNHICIKGGAIFAVSPSRNFEFCVANGEFNFKFRDASFDGIQTVENREMLTNNLLSAVLLENGSPSVPCGNMPGGVQHEYGVVFDRIDQSMIGLADLKLFAYSFLFEPILREVFEFNESVEQVTIKNRHNAG